MTAEHLYDVRTIERNIHRKLLSREDYQRYLESLEDCADRATPVATEFSRTAENAAKKQAD